jgi:hypothetical protein
MWGFVHFQIFSISFSEGFKVKASILSRKLFLIPGFLHASSLPIEKKPMEKQKSTYRLIKDSAASEA